MTNFYLGRLNFDMNLDSCLCRFFRIEGISTESYTGSTGHHFIIPNPTVVYLFCINRSICRLGQKSYDWAFREE